MMNKFFLFFSFLQTIVCAAQVPVSKEPMHHNVFENAFVRVLDVHVAPGDTSQFHKHETPSVFIVLNAAKTGSEVIMEEAKATALYADATISFEGFYKTPRVHRVWNEGTDEFHVMDIELLSKNSDSASYMINEKSLTFLFDAKPVRAYRLTLEGRKELKLKTQNPFLVVGLTNAGVAATVNEKKFAKKGDFVFIAPEHGLQILNKGEQPYSFAVLELK